MGGVPRFTRPRPKGGGEDGGDASPNLYVANCGPAVGLSYDDVAAAFGAFGEVKGVYAADESGARVIVSYIDLSSAEAALKSLNGRPCPSLGGRSVHIRYSVLQPAVEVHHSIPVSLTASEVNIPGLHLLHDFVSAKEEKELVAAVDDRPWKKLSKRRVRHYGYEFCYETRNVNTEKHLGELPTFVSTILERISAISDIDDPPRSMLLLSREACYAWHHYIPHHKIDMVNGSVIRSGSRRISFTFCKVFKIQVIPCVLEKLYISRIPCTWWLPLPQVPSTAKSAKQRKRWWLPLPQVPSTGLSDLGRKRLLHPGCTS